MAMLESDAHKHTAKCMSSLITVKYKSVPIIFYTPFGPWARHPHQHPAWSSLTWVLNDAWPHPYRISSAHPWCTCLGAQGPVSGLFELQPKEDVELTHHTHLELPGHSIYKLGNKSMRRTTKDNIIHVIWVGVLKMEIYSLKLLEGHGDS